MGAVSLKWDHEEMAASARWMRAHGETLEGIARALGVSRRSVSNYLRRASPRCPVCDSPMREPADRCGFCAAEASQVAA